MFIANLNVFVAAWIVLFFSLRGIISMSLVLPLSLLSSFTRVENWMWAAAGAGPIVVIGVVLIVVWVRYGLSPSIRKPGRERRYRIGHGLLGALNIAAIAIVLVPYLLAKIGGQATSELVAFYLIIPALGLGIPAGLAGLYMVWSSRIATP